MESKLENAFYSLSECFEDKIIKDNKGLYENLQKEFDNLGIDFFISLCVDDRLDKYTFLAERVIGKGIISKNKWILSYYVDGEFKRFLRTYITKKEGSCCCGDKESFVFSTCYKAIKEDRNISLYNEYKNEKRQAYWSPASLKDTDEVFEKFEIYLNSCRKIIEQL